MFCFEITPMASQLARLVMIPGQHADADSSPDVPPILGSLCLSGLTGQYLNKGALLGIRQRVSVLREHVLSNVLQ